VTTPQARHFARELCASLTAPATVLDLPSAFRNTWFVQFPNPPWLLRPDGQRSRWQLTLVARLWRTGTSRSCSPQSSQRFFSLLAPESLPQQFAQLAGTQGVNVKSNLTIGALDDSGIGEYTNAGNADIAVIAENRRNRKEETATGRKVTAARGRAKARSYRR
jgi:hypothetical protein